MSQPTGGSASGAVSVVMLTSKCMVVAVVSLLAVAFVVSLVYLFAKRCWGLGNPTHCDGLDAAVLESLPVKIFRSSDSDVKEVGVGVGVESECAVCISELSEGDETRVLPKCRHRFHLHCIDMWFQSQSTCPLCRSPVVPEPSAGREDVSYSPETGGALLFQDQKSTGYLKAGIGSREGPSSSISLVIEIPRPQTAEGIPGSGSGEEMKTPPSSTLMMLTKLCSSCSPIPSPSPRGRDIDLGGTAERSSRTNL